MLNMYWKSNHFPPNEKKVKTLLRVEVEIVFYSIARLGVDL